eukprot:9100337-Lingulodinium_polyedra.AAC.1
MQRAVARAQHPNDVRATDLRAVRQPQTARAQPQTCQTAQFFSLCDRCSSTPRARRARAARLVREHRAFHKHVVLFMRCELFVKQARLHVTV